MDSTNKYISLTWPQFSTSHVGIKSILLNFTQLIDYQYNEYTLYTIFIGF